MRVLRAKQYRKHLRFFKVVYGITPTYQLLLDGNFLHVCLTKNHDIITRITKLLQGEKVELCTTKCVVNELESMGETCAAAATFAKKNLKLIRCGHETNLPAAECLAATVGEDNQGKYFVASQDSDMRSHLRSVPGVPIIYANRTIMILEPPSNVSMSNSRKLEGKKTLLNDEERRMVKQARSDIKKEREASMTARLLPRGVFKETKGPNPLSVKKAKKVPATQQQETAGGEKKKKTRRKKAAKKENDTA